MEPKQLSHLKGLGRTVGYVIRTQKEEVHDVNMWLLRVVKKPKASVGSRMATAIVIVLMMIGSFILQSVVKFCSVLTFSLKEGV